MSVTTAAQTVVKKSLMSRGFQRVRSYIRQVAEDYQVVFTEAVEDIPRHPIRSLMFMSTVGTAITAAAMNPTERDMLDRIGDYRNSMGLIPNSIHSSLADKTLIDRTDMYNTNRYDYLNCLLFSIVLRRKYDSKVDLYAAQDSNLQDWPWDRVFKNFVDFGAFNRFWMLERAFVNPDINEEEFVGARID